MQKHQPNFWMAIESYHNWCADQRNNFQFMGMSEYGIERAKQVMRGDLVFVYVPAPRSSFSDIRIVSRAGLHRSGHSSVYDIPCYAGLITKPAVVLDAEKWLKIKTIIGGLSFVRLKAGWGNALRKSFRKIKPMDAEVIIDGMMRLNLIYRGLISTKGWDWQSLSRPNEGGACRNRLKSC
jgi:hypothetical protein